MSSVPKLIVGDWTPKKTRALERAWRKSMHNQAFHHGPESFEFDGQKFANGYAGYLIAHLRQVFNLK